MKVNLGQLKNGVYRKNIDFSRAVLWRDRMISLTPLVVEGLKKKNCQTILFVDNKKGEIWECSFWDFMQNAILKAVGQERQYYCPISIFKRTQTKKPIPYTVKKSAEVVQLKLI